LESWTILFEKLKKKQLLKGTYRKVFCKYYCDCLNRTIEQGLTDFNCEGCGKYEESIPDTDLQGECLLLWGIFRPELLKKYREIKKGG